MYSSWSLEEVEGGDCWCWFLWRPEATIHCVLHSHLCEVTTYLPVNNVISGCSMSWYYAPNWSRGALGNAVVRPSLSLSHDAPSSKRCILWYSYYEMLMPCALSRTHWSLWLYGHCNVRGAYCFAAIGAIICWPWDYFHCCYSRLQTSFLYGQW